MGYWIERQIVRDRARGVWHLHLYVLRDPDNNEMFLLVYVDDLLMFHTPTSGGDRLREQFAKW